MTALPSRVDALAAGMHWLYRTRQPADAILSHHGITLHADGNRHYTFVPSGWHGFAVVVVEVTKVVLSDPHSPYACPVNPLQSSEMTELAGLLSGFGAEVTDTWNGGGLVTGSLALKKAAHPSLLDAVARYRAGCPLHNSVFCGRPHDDRKPCSWYGDGAARVIRPSTSAGEVAL